MSFVLPGNARELRFTGEVKARPPARADGAGALALGKPRLRKPPPPPAPAARAHHAPAPAAKSRVPTPAPSGPLPPPAPAARAHHAPAAAAATSRVPTPAPSGPLPTLASRGEIARRPYAGPFDPPTARRHDDSVVDDESPTTWMERDALDVLPGAKAIRAPKPSPAFAAPIPHFRAAPLAASEPKMIIIPGGTASSKVKTTTSGAPLAVWLLAAVVAGVVSYFVAPELVARLESPAHAASQR